MTIKRTLLLGCLLLLLPWPAAAQDEPVIYTIKKGDTLWGISERFIKDPYYWPNLWAHNPEVPNPHFIYPGQQLAIYDGRIVIVPAPGAPASPPPAVEAAPPAAAPPAAPAAPAPALVPPPPAAITLKVSAPGEGFLTLAEFNGLGEIVDADDNRVLLTEGDSVLIRISPLVQAAPGMFFSLFSVDREVAHPVTGKLVGYRIFNLGTVMITQVTDTVAVGKITQATREIERGARLRIYQPPQREVVLKRAERELGGHIISSSSNQKALGQNELIYLDLGSLDGLSPGNMLYISRPRKATDLSLQPPDLPLPDLLIGSAVVLQTGPTTASALVLKSTNAIFLGDRVTTVTE